MKLTVYKDNKYKTINITEVDKNIKATDTPLRTIHLFSASTHRPLQWPIFFKFPAPNINNTWRENITNIFHAKKRQAYFLTRLLKLTGPATRK